MELWIEDDNGRISIGSKSTMEGGHFAVTEGKSISIGKDCMFSKDIEIRTRDSHAIFDSGSKQRINQADNVKIQDHIWLGADVKVLKGAIILKNSIIGTGGIVTWFIESNSIYTGIPAKKVKSDIFWTRQR